jgi:hypothetical protein
VPKAKKINEKHTEQEQDVLNQIVKQVPKAKQINAKDTAEEQDVLN